MRNIFELTTREERIIIVIAVLLVAAALGKHYFDLRSGPRSVRSTSTLSPTATPLVAPEDVQTPEPDEAP